MMKSLRWCLCLLLALFIWVVFYFIQSNLRISKIFYDNTTLQMDLQSAETPTEGTTVVTSPIDGRTTSLLKQSNSFVVPNIVHYIWFGEFLPMKFHQMLSVLSVHRLLKPDEIQVHCDYKPIGQWWDYLTNTLKVPLTIVKCIPPKKIYGNRLFLPEHQSDIKRIDILLQHGGIYLDFDVIALKSFDYLRKYQMTMGLEYFGKPGRLNSGILVAEKNATFLQIWRGTYTNFTYREWDVHSCQLTYNLQFMYPHLIHVEEKTLNYPSGPKYKLIYERIYDWSKNYAMHLWYHRYNKESSPKIISKMNTTFGQISRLVYYGSPELREH